MNLANLQKQIVNNELMDFYIFQGNELYIQKVYIEKMAKLRNLEICFVDNYKSIYNILYSKNLFDMKKLYVIVNDEDILKQDQVWDNLKNTNGNILIFKYHQLDKRGKFYKTFEPNLVEFNPLGEEILVNYIQKDINLNKSNCLKLIDICGANYDRILLEINKINNYQILDLSPDEKFLELEKSGAFIKEVSDIIFNFIDAIIRRDIPKVYMMYNEFKKGNESILGFMTLLYNNLKTILLIQSCKSKDISKTTGLSTNQIYYNQNKINYYSNIELINSLKLLQRLDLSIKNGTIEEPIVLDYILVNIL